jgi:hypothetical protein
MGDGRTEGVAHKQPIAQRRQLPRKRFVVGLLLGVIANIFEQQDAAVRKRAAFGFGLGADAIGSEGHRRSDQLSQSRGGRFETVLGIGFAFGTAQVRRQHQPRAALPRQF